MNIPHVLRQHSKYDVRQFYLNVATQLQVGQPITKLLSGLVVPSQTSSMQLAVHISHMRTWAFCLKWLADLGVQRDMQHLSVNTHTLVLILDPGINRIDQ